MNKRGRLRRRPLFTLIILASAFDAASQPSSFILFTLLIILLLGKQEEASDASCSH
jgi:hypothetical protein